MTLVIKSDDCVILLADNQGKVIGAKYNGKEIPVYSFSINETGVDDIQTVTLTVPMRLEIKIAE